MKHEYDLRAEKKILENLEESEKFTRWFTVYCVSEKQEVVELFLETRRKLSAIFSKYKDGDDGISLTWEEIAENAMGKGFGEPNLDVYNNARRQVAEKFGIDIEKSECPEDEIEDACREHAVVFDRNGNIAFYVSTERKSK